MSIEDMGGQRTTEKVHMEPASVAVGITDDHRFVGLMFEGLPGPIMLPPNEAEELALCIFVATKKMKDAKS